MKNLFLAALFCATSAFAQYPAKPIRMIVPLVPGGNQDIVARAVAEEMSKNLGQQVIVEIGRASCRERCHVVCRSRWSPYH